MRICLPLRLVGLLIPLVSSLDSLQHHTSLAFAGGFGSQPKQRKKKSKQTRGSGLPDLEIKKPLGQHSNIKRSDDEPKLDKWGLPIPTEDDLFPPMPPGTEIVSAPSDQSLISLKTTIQDSLREHVKLNLTRFDENGFEQDCIPGRQPMRLRLLHVSPPVLEIQHFFTPEECQEVKAVTRSQKSYGLEAMRVESATFSPFATSRRTSTSWFCHYAQMPTLLAKAMYALGLPLTHMEEPQIVRYLNGQEFSWHYDEVPASQLANGGQRIATLLVYLNDVEKGGGTIFKHLKGPDGTQLTVKPTIGSALLFFPAFDDGRPDDRTLHKGETALETKWITQMWIHQQSYSPVVPPGNFHRAALPKIQRVCDDLHYNPRDHDDMKLH